MKERRKYTRITVNIPVALSLYQFEVYHTGTIADISEGGCFFPFGEELPVGEACHITIVTGAGLETETLTLPGEIVHSGGGGAGISFAELEPASRTRLKKLLDYHMSISDQT